MQRYSEIFIKNIGNIIITEVDLNENFVEGLKNSDTVLIEKIKNKYFYSLNDNLIKNEINNKDIQIIFEGILANDIKNFFNINS